jgi:thiol-disulfide isomerase/thioredoxin
VPVLWTILALALSGALVQTPATDIVADVRASIDAGDLTRADAALTGYRRGREADPQTIEAVSWLARGARSANQLDRAERYANEALDLGRRWLGNRPLTGEHLVTALGNAIEVLAQIDAARGARSDAILLLEQALRTYKDTPLHKRLQKNINLLTLEGRAAPALERAEFIGTVRPQSLTQLKGKVVVLFFWAHWCPDCKIEGPILAKLFAKYAPQGLAVVAPTQRYGYGAAGAPLGPADELRYIVTIRDQYYPFLASLPVPVSEANHKRYGVSSTPTMVITDRAGIVRVYHPGRMTEQELESAIVRLLAPARTASGD